MRHFVSSPRGTLALVAAGLAALGVTPAHATPPGVSARAASAPASSPASTRGALASNRPVARLPARAGAPATAAPAPPAPPPAPVALQLSGLVIGIPVARAAVLHAIARDSWPRLVACANRAPAARGSTTVEIVEMQDELEVRLRGGPVVRDRALATCVQQAVGAVVLPPYEGEAPATSVAFDLAFNLPPVASPPAARGARRR